MIIRALNKIIGTNRDVSWANGRSRRFITDADSMGFTMTDTTVKANSETTLQYLDNLEACYCIEGCGEIELCSDGSKNDISVGTMYALDKHDKHIVRAFKDMRLVCVFNPALATK